MNQYGRRAQTYWQQHLPTQYAQIANPTSFFEEMGEALAQQIDELADAIANRTPSTGDFMANLGRLNGARQEAEMEVLREMLPQPETTAAQTDEATVS
ncbi:hypothetical protein [Asanoa siamensis]|uniref:Uncharacterized protein n=2 Tax=Asanoa TaxID=195964 RepID=A0A239PFA7_9ACTN|nr:hypothetical protein [Asanoa siamensis]GIF74186.1 hypothetical protein Asi02nite_37040 [Asanoa siamensis]SNT65702.1 hypothetical protein SAMN05421812_12545 [Asanoa hainanensis]